jgi:hypothetical protein
MAKSKKTEQAAATPNFADLLNQTAKPATENKKAKYPVITLPEKLATHLTAFQKHKADMKNSEALMREEESPILEYIGNYQDERALAGQYDGTISIENKVTYLKMDKWTVPQDEEVITALKETLGEKFDKVIYRETTVTLKKEVFENPDLQKELVAAIGDKFSKFFVTETKWTARKGLDENIFRIVIEIAEKTGKKALELLLTIRGYLKQAKAMLKG